MSEFGWFIVAIVGATTAYIYSAFTWRKRGWQAGLMNERVEWHKLMIAAGLGRYISNTEFVTSGQYHHGHHTGYFNEAKDEPPMRTFVCDLWEDEHTTVGLKGQEKPRPKKPTPPENIILREDKDPRLQPRTSQPSCSVMSDLP